MIRKIRNLFKRKTPRLPNKLVIVESPYFNEDPDILLANIEYARACMTDCLVRRESPFLSHLLYTQIMDDRNTDLRQLGIDAGLDWGKVAQETIVYTDRGMSKGMQYGIERATADGRPITYRSLYKDHAHPSDAVTKHLLDACPDEVKEQLHHREAEFIDQFFGDATAQMVEDTENLLHEMKDVPPTTETIKQVDRLLGDTIRRTHAVFYPEGKPMSLEEAKKSYKSIAKRLDLPEHCVLQVLTEIEKQNSKEPSKQ